MIAGTRIPVYLILNLLASGYDSKRIIEAYPGLTEEDIRAALEYAGQRMRYSESLCTALACRSLTPFPAAFGGTG